MRVMPGAITPDGWVILKVTPVEGNPFYKVFGSWGGGFASGDSWRLSSGGDPEKLTRNDNDTFTWVQQSGSVYTLPAGGENRITAHNSATLNNLLESANEHETIQSCEVVELSSILPAEE